MSKKTVRLVTHRENRGAETAIIFIHGFSGHPEKTWGRFPEFLSEAESLNQWNIYSLGYSTRLSIDIKGIWAADPSIPTLADYLRTRVELAPFKDYKSLALVAHSMGGLVVQRALLDDRDFTARISHVFLFGTPSGGLTKAGLFSWIKQQVKNMDADSEFISELRNKWSEQFPIDQKRPFKFWVIAGDRDQFVPPESSLLPFPSEDQWMVYGNHIEIVDPDEPNSESVQLIINGIVGDAAPGGPWNSARVAVETGEFNRAIEVLSPQASELDEKHLVQLALALDSTGKRQEAIDILEQERGNHTDAIGVLAGRLKRRWLVEGRKADAESALELYTEAYDLSVKANKYDQAFYHGINVAFMQIAYASDNESARKIASEVLEHCKKAMQDRWCVATVGEALLHLTHIEEAMEAYREYVAMNPSPREMETTYTQAYYLLGIMGNEDFQSSLDDIFRGVNI